MITNKSAAGPFSKMSLIEESNSKRVVSTKSDKVYISVGDKKEPYLLSYTISCSVDEDESAYLEQINEAMKELEMALAEETQTVQTGSTPSTVRDGQSKRVTVLEQGESGLDQVPTRDAPSAMPTAAVASFSLTSKFLKSDSKVLVLGCPRGGRFWRRLVRFSASKMFYTLYFRFVASAWICTCANSKVTVTVDVGK